MERLGGPDEEARQSFEQNLTAELMASGYPLASIRFRWPKGSALPVVTIAGQVIDCRDALE